MSAPSARRTPKTNRPASTTTAEPTAPAGNLDADSETIAVQPEEIARLAYSYWEARGGQGGSAEEDWLRAERQLRAGT